MAFGFLTTQCRAVKIHLELMIVPAQLYLGLASSKNKRAVHGYFPPALVPPVILPFFLLKYFLFWFGLTPHAEQFKIKKSVKFVAFPTARVRAGDNGRNGWCRCIG